MSLSFQGSVGLLVYQGPDVHVAFLFFTPFSHTLHGLEFTLAVLTGPITSDQLDCDFDSLIQKKGSREMKVVKFVLLVPREILELEHESLTIRSIMSNVQMAKMNVIVQTNAFNCSFITALLASSSVEISSVEVRTWA